MKSDKNSEESKKAAEPCSVCSGGGYEENWDRKRNKPIPCEKCKGTGFAHPELHKRGEYHKNRAW